MFIMATFNKSHLLGLSRISSISPKFACNVYVLAKIDSTVWVSIWQCLEFSRGRQTAASAMAMRTSRNLKVHETTERLHPTSSVHVGMVRTSDPFRL
ncbi:hypothetical protein Btru_076633 [Bulinus truncatus]|nr:hypothetical protein Btru_076633 [Bulinus truncatus]